MAVSLKQPAVLLLFCIVVVLIAIPLLYDLIKIILCLKRRVPLSVGIVTGLGRFGVFYVSLVMIVYCGAVLYTAKQETTLRKVYMARVRDESGYDASLVHQKWPGPP